MNREHERITLLRRRARQAGRWAAREFGESLLCALFVYLGVVGSTALPAGLLALLSAPEPAAAWLALSPLAAIPIAARVFDVRAWPRWRAGHRTLLGTRILRAYSDGVLWLRWWRAV